MLNIGGTARSVFAHFEVLSSIPRGSGNTGEVADLLVRFADERGLSCYRDEANNVIIRKPATAGYESRPTVIIQGHTDMVAEKTPDSEKDMSREGLDLYVDGDYLRAKGTTLGGDDGVAVAYALALLDSTDIPHPPLEALFTSDEEIGLIGATALDPSQLSGRIMINVDSDVEGVFTVGCAGGLRCDLTLPVERGGCDGACYRLSLSGLRGGHSGTEIDKCRLNAIKELVGLLSSLPDIRLVSLEGGNADNAIPRDAAACFVAGGDILPVAEAAISALLARACDTEPELSCRLEECDATTLALTAESTERTLAMLSELPTGVVAMSGDVEGLVETSLNMGIVRLDPDACRVSHSVRSAKGAGKRALTDRLIGIGKKYGATSGERGEYPAWEYKSDSHLRRVMTEVYRDRYGKEPQVLIIHAGLECGIFSEKLEGLDCVSIGPDNLDIHTPEERLSISSTERVWEFLLEVLRKI